MNLLQITTVLLCSFLSQSQAEKENCAADTRYESATIHHVDTQLSEAVAHYEENGYAILRGVLDPEIIQEVSY